MVPLESRVGKVQCSHAVVMVLDGSVRLHTWKGPVQSVVMVLDGSIRERIVDGFGRVSSN